MTEVEASADCMVGGEEEGGWWINGFEVETNERSNTWFDS